MKHFFAYYRVSTEKQDKNLTYEVQQDSVKNYAENNNIEIIKEFKDQGSGKHINDQLLLMLTQLDGINGILVYDQSRLTRNPTHLEFLRDRLKKVEVHNNYGPVDWETPEGILTSGIQTETDQYHRLKTSQRTKDAYKKNIKMDGPKPGKKTKWGRPKKISDSKFNSVIKKDFITNKKVLAMYLEVSRKTLYEYLKNRYNTIPSISFLKAQQNDIHNSNKL